MRADLLEARPTLRAWLDEYAAIEADYLARLADWGIRIASRDADADVVRAAKTAEVGRDANGNGEFRSRADTPSPLAATANYPVCVTDAGYIQYIDPAILLTLAQENDLFIRSIHKPGSFVRPGGAVALVWPADWIDAQREKLIRRAFQLGNVRTPTQDIVYAVNQLTEMAVRAMSPAINDPFTAMTCLDLLGVGLATFIRQGENDTAYYDGDGALRLVLERATFADLLSATFDMLRHASCDNASVLLHMLAVIDVVGQATPALAARQQLLHHVGLIQAESQAGALIEEDRRRIAESSEAVTMKLK